MSTKLLMIDPTRCDGCGECETACSGASPTRRAAGLSCIKIMKADFRGRLHIPTTCQQCEKPPCGSICPKGAIYRDDALNRVVVATDLCVGCKMCVSACPFGAMDFDPVHGIAFKCDLCDGDPACVKVCEANALEYVEGSDLNRPRIQDSADKHYAVLHMQVGGRRPNHTPVISH